MAGLIDLNQLINANPGEILRAFLLSKRQVMDFFYNFGLKKRYNTSRTAGSLP